jgi:hypothetical protein
MRSLEEIVACIGEAQINQIVSLIDLDQVVAIADGSIDQLTVTNHQLTESQVVALAHLVTSIHLLNQLNFLDFKRGMI